MSFGEVAHLVFNTPGIGGAIVLTVIVAAPVVYTFLARWILAGDDVERENVRRIR